MNRRRLIMGQSLGEIEPVQDGLVCWVDGFDSYVGNKIWNKVTTRAEMTIGYPEGWHAQFKMLDNGFIRFFRAIAHNSTVSIKADVPYENIRTVEVIFKIGGQQSVNYNIPGFGESAVGFSTSNKFSKALERWSSTSHTISNFSKNTMFHVFVTSIQNGKIEYYVKGGTGNLEHIAPIDTDVSSKNISTIFSYIFGNPVTELDDYIDVGAIRLYTKGLTEGEVLQNRKYEVEVTRRITDD